MKALIFKADKPDVTLISVVQTKKKRIFKKDSENLNSEIFMYRFLT